MSGKKKKSTKRSSVPELDAQFADIPASDLLSANVFASVSELKASYQSAGPYPHLFIENFCNDEFLQVVKSEMAHLEFNPKSNDLYDFAQSGDLRGCTLPATARLRDALYGSKFRQFLTEITGIEFNDIIDMSAAVYKDTDKLLCHDDELEGRRIAYILYLVPEEWQASDGGALDLFCVDSTGNPSHSVKSLTPQWNAFAFFEVSPVSFHQVAEVISKQRRNSVVGWFHGEPVKRDPLLPDPPVAFSIPQSISSSASETLKEWIAPVYLKAQTLASIRTAFVDQSSITLPNFFRSDKYSAVLSAMEQQSTPPGRIDIPTGSNGNVDHPNSSTANKWTMIGPPNKRHFWQYKCESNAADIVQQCAKFLCSSNLAMLLQEMTGLSLSSVCQPEVRKFNHGCYTMGHDTDPGLTQPGLDVCFSLATKAWNSEKWGGHTQYLDSEEALLAFDPLPNQLSLVFRGAPGAFRFVKHVNHKAKDSARYDMECTFHVDDDDDDEIVQ